MRVLIITYHFPPDASAGAVRPYQFARLLPRYGIEPYVVTVLPEFAERYEPSYQPVGVEPEHVFRTEVLPSKRQKCERILHRIVGRTATRLVLRLQQRSYLPPSEDYGASVEIAPDPRNAPVSKRLLRFVGDWFVYPSAYAGWKKPALLKIREVKQNHDIEVVLSTSPPRIAHLIAYEVAGRYGLPWVMDLQDPWIHKKQRSAFWHRQLEKLFDRCLSRVDAIIANTETYANLLRERYPAFENRVFAVPNGIDESLLERKWSEATGGLTIGFFGTLYPHQRQDWFWRGVAQWLEQYPEARQHVRFHLYGTIHQDVKGLAATLAKAGDLVEVSPLVPRHQVPALMDKCAALLLFAAGHLLQIPSKVYEYLASNKPILAVTEPDSATARLLRRYTGCYICCDSRSVVEALEDCWRGTLAGGMYPNRDLQDMTYSNLTANLVVILTEVKSRKISS